MSKASTPKKTAGNAASKTPAAFAKKGNNSPSNDQEDPSKFKPTPEATEDLLALEPRDGVIKLFTDSIKDLYWAENHLIKALPKMAKAATAKSLAKAINDHLDKTVTHAARLEQVFGILGIKVQAKKCDAMEGLSKEGEGVIETTDPGSPARDLGIIMASQKVEHYEISAYTGLVKLADDLGYPEISALLTETLNEEIDSDDLLSRIADKDIKY